MLALAWTTGGLTVATVSTCHGEDRTMADGHFQDVELLRRELAILILEWAGKAVKDDPDGPMSTALTRAVSEAARGAVAEQHQVLTTDAADRIAEALEQRGAAGSLFVWRASAWSLGLAAAAMAALLALAFLLGMQAGRTEGALPAESAAAAASTVPIAPIAPTVDEPALSTAAAPRASTPRPAARAQRPAPPPAKPAARSQPRELGRPAPASDETSPRSTQPVGAATTPPAAPVTVSKP